MDWKVIVSHAGYEDEAECVANILEANNIHTLLQLENSVGKLGHVCNVDIYRLVAAVRQVFSEGVPAEEPDSADQVSEADPEEEYLDEETTPQDEDNGED